MSKEPKRNVYVGHRYVPKIMGEWNNEQSYEGLSIVTHKGTSYTSKKHVPVGVDISDEEYWVVTGNYNAQIEHYRKEVKDMENNVNNKMEETVDYVEGKVNDLKDYVNNEIEKKANQSDLDETNQQLAQTVKVANVLAFGAIGDFDPKTQTGTNNLEAFKRASQYAKENDLTIVVPKGNYLIDGYLEIFDSIIGEGVLYFPNNNPNAKLKISSKHEPINLDPRSLGGLNENSTKITGLGGDYTNGTLIIESDEVLIERNNPPSNIPYTKNEVAIITSKDGDITPPLDNNYDLNYNLNVRVVPQEKSLTVSIKIRGFGEENKSGDLITCNRSNVKFYKLDSKSIGGDIKTHIFYNNCALIEFDNVVINKARYSGQGYGVSVGNSAFSVFKNCHIHDCNHALTGRHGKAVTITGGSYSDDIDSHWGSNYVIDNVYVKGGIIYAGKDLKYTNSKQDAIYEMVKVRSDTPELKGNVIVENIDVSFSGSLGYGNLYYVTASPEFEWRELHQPDLISFKNINVLTEGTRIYLYTTGTNLFSNKNKPFKKMVFDNVKSPSNIITFRVDKFDDYQNDIDYNPVIIIKNIDFNLESPSSQIRRVNTSTPLDKTWFYELNMENCRNIRLSLDSVAFTDSQIKKSTIKYINRLNEYNEKIGDLFLIECDIKDAHLTGEFYYQLINTKFGGQITSSAQGGFDNSFTSRIKRSSGCVKEIGTTGIDVDLSNYVNPDFYEI